MGYTMGNSYCFNFQVRFTEEEYCLYNKENNILYVNNGVIQNIIFDKCDKTLGTVSVSVDDSDITQKKISLISKVPNKEERVIKSFFYEPPINNNNTMLSKGIINKCHNYEILYKTYSSYTNTKLKLQFLLTKEIKTLFPKYYKEGDNVNVKLLVDEKADRYDAVMSMNKCYACLEVNIFSNIEKLEKAKNIRVVKDTKCNKVVIACFQIYILKNDNNYNNYNNKYYGVKMDRCEYCYTFTSSGYTFTQLGDDIDGEAVGDNSGYSVSLSSDGAIVAIGALWNNYAVGHVRIYKYNDSNSNWAQLGQDIDGEEAYDFSGISISLSSCGTIVAIGSVWNDGNGDASGHVRIYKYNGHNWEQLGHDIDGEAVGDNSGYSVSLSSDGSIVGIGAPFNYGNDFDSGHVRIYKRNMSY